MPYFSDYTDWNNPRLNDTDNTGGLFRGAAAGAGGDGGVVAQEGNNVNAAPTKTGSNFTNLDNYFTANAGSNIGNDLSNKVSSNINQASQDQTSAVNAFNNQVQQHNQVPSAQQVTQAVQNPVQASPEDYQKWINQSYQGPTNLSGSPSLFNQYHGKSGEARQHAQALTGSPGEQYTLLQDYFGKPGRSYTQGQKALDASIAGQSPGFGARAQNLNQRASQLGSSQPLHSIAKTVGDQAAKINDSTNRARQEVGIDRNGQILGGSNAGALGRQQEEIKNAVNSANDFNRGQHHYFVNSLNQKGISEADKQKYGLQGLKNFNGLQNPAQFVTPGETLNAAHVMSPEQMSRYNALTQLAGVVNTYPQQAVARPAPFTVNSQGLLDAWKAANPEPPKAPPLAAPPIFKPIPQNAKPNPGTQKTNIPLPINPGGPKNGPQPLKKHRPGIF